MLMVEALAPIVSGCQVTGHTWRSSSSSVVVASAELAFVVGTALPEAKFRRHEQCSGSEGGSPWSLTTGHGAQAQMHAMAVGQHCFEDCCAISTNSGQMVPLARFWPLVCLQTLPDTHVSGWCPVLGASNPLTICQSASIHFCPDIHHGHLCGNCRQA